MSINTGKKSRGRPKANTIEVSPRFDADVIRRVEEWAMKQTDKPHRAEAIRRLVDIGLSVKHINNG